MYVTKLSVENVRLLANQTLSFRQGAQPRMWTVLLGENGTCKTTVLQAIALGLAGSEGVAVGETTRWLRQPAPNGLASVAFLTGSAGAVLPVASGPYYGAMRGQLNNQEGYFPLSAEVPDILGPLRDPNVEVESRLRLTSLMRDPLPDGPGASAIGFLRAVATEPDGFFVAGYGAQRTLPQPQDAGEQVRVGRTADRVASLFDRRHRMAGTNFFKLFSDNKPELAAPYQAELQRLLRTHPTLLPAVDLHAEDKRLIGLDNGTRTVSLPMKSGPVRYRTAAHNLSEGYQSTLAWIADLIGQYMYASGRAVPCSEMVGVVLLDEIDLHLHPTWQRQIVPTLKAVFPKMQFIVTTHSPLVLTGFEADEIIRLELGDDGLIHARAGGAEPGLLSATGILDQWFGTIQQVRPELLNAEREYVKLYALQEPTSEQKRRLDELQAVLGPYWAARKGASR